MTAPDRPWLSTRIGIATPDSIRVRGYDLSRELMGHITLADLSYLLATGALPTKQQQNVLEAILVALADHGLTPSALAARFTYTGAPESLQAAVAAGLLGAGSVFLGPTEDTARFLAAILEQIPVADRAETELSARCVSAVEAQVAAGRLIPGLGHPMHKAEDPRVPRLYEIAEQNDLLGWHLRLLALLPGAAEKVTGRSLPINGAGATGAALADLGVRPDLARGFALLARTAGLIGQLAEEMERPLGHHLYRDVEENVQYEDGR